MDRNINFSRIKTLFLRIFIYSNFVKIYQFRAIIVSIIGNRPWERCFFGDIALCSSIIKIFLIYYKVVKCDY